MFNIAEKLYGTLNVIEDIERLISEGETEGQYLECKSPQQVIIDRNFKVQISKEISAFSNAGGGIVIFGVSTTKHDHLGAEFLSQIEEIGLVRKFKKELDLVVATSIEPSIISCDSKIILKSQTDTRGVVVLHIPATPGDPVRNIHDREFYIRVGDACHVMPYETVKKMFAGSSGPDLSALFDNRLVKLQDDGSWRIPIILENKSSAVAKDVDVSVSIQNQEACDQVGSENLKDQSSINPGQKIFMADFTKPIFRGKQLLAGYVIVKMKKLKYPKRNLVLKVDIFASDMRAKTYTMNVRLAKKGFSVTKIQSGYLY